MYRLGCQVFVSLYMSMDCLEIWIIGRISNAAAKKKVGVMCAQKGAGRLYDISQTVMSRIWLVATGGRGREKNQRRVLR